MTTNLPPAAERMATMLDEIDRLENTFGSDVSQWPAGQRERHDRLVAGVKRARTEADAEASAEEQRERIREAMANPANRENGFAAFDVPKQRQAPWAGLDENIVRTESGAGMIARAHDVLSYTPGLSDTARGMLADTIDSNDGATAAAFVVARSNPAYRTAFEKVLRNPERAHFTFTGEEAAAFRAVESIRATLTTNTGSGGYTVPLALDPNLAALVNNGIANPWRSISDAQTTISSPARAIASTGVNGEWVAEGSVMADATPTFTKVDIPLYKLDAYVSASFEILGDAGTTVAGALPLMFADARDRAEGTVFATGDGTTQPKGLVTALSASSAFVTATTRGSFTTASAVDVFATWAALPARARQSRKVAWFGNVSILNIVRQLGTAAPAALYTVDMTEESIPKLLGAPVFEASAMTAATTSGSLILAAQDMAKYRIVDHIAGPALEFIPVMFDQATGRPNGTRGWIWWERVGADLLDTTQGKLLKA